LTGFAEDEGNEVAITGSGDRRTMELPPGCRYKRCKCAVVTCHGLGRNRRSAGNAVTSRGGEVGAAARGGRADNLAGKEPERVNQAEPA
jgi:hypothetical protein